MGVSVTAPDAQPNDPPSPEVRLSRRQLLPLVGVAALASAFPIGSASAQQSAPAAGGGAAEDTGAVAPSRYVYVGTYTAPHTAPGGTQPSTAVGVYVFKLDGQTGGLSQVQVVPLENPSWVTLDPQGRYLYAISEVDTWKGTANSGGITAYAIDATTGMLTAINDQPTMGAIAAHAIVDPAGKYVLVANYNGSNFVVLPIQPNGGLGPVSQVVTVSGTGPDASRQEMPHPHQIQFDPAAKFVFGNDLGTDKVWVWTFDAAQGKLTPTPLPAIQVASGSGPRHSAFHPTGKAMYVIAEMGSAVSAFSYDATKGQAIWLQTLSTLPPDFRGTSTCAELIMHPSGRWLYGSNRGHDSIVGYAVDQATGRLTVIDWWSTQGMVPRGFTIEPSGAFLLAGNQNSDSVVPFRIGQDSGRLTPTGAVTNTPVPVTFGFGRPITAK